MLIPALLVAGLFVWAACSSPVRPLQDKAPPSPQLQALIVELRGKLGTTELAYCHRALRTAQDQGMQAVVFDLDFAGNLGESAADVAALLDRLQASTVTTVAYVRGHAVEGAAYLALLCDQLFLAPGADLGSVYHSEFRWADLLTMSPEDAERLRLQAFRQELVQRLEQRKVKLSSDAVLLCEGMVDPGLQLVRATVRQGGIEQLRVYDAGDLQGLEAKGITVIAQTPVTQPVQLSAAEAVDAGIGSGVMQSIEQIVTDHLTIGRENVGVLEYPNWSERMVGWLEMLQPGLLVLGFVLLVLEVKTPGVGLPGLLGTTFLALALFYSYLVGLAEVSEVLLFFLGLASLAVEIFLLPGLVVFGAVGFLCLVFALVLSRQSFVLPSSVSEQDILFHNLANLTLLSVVVIVVAVSMWRILPKVPLLNRLYLPAPDAAGTQPAGAGGLQSRTGLVGKLARAVTTLRPSGAVELDGERLDVVTNGEFVEAGCQVRIVAVAGNRILVEVVGDGGQRGSAGLVLLLGILGILLLVAEVFFVSFGVLFLLSAACLFGAVFLAFQESVAFGTAVLLGEGALVPAMVWLAFKVLPKTPFGRALMLEGPKPEEVHSAPDGLAQLVGRAGVALSPLRPAGFARIDGRKIDVVTRGEMIEQGQPVRVVEVQGNRVVVKVGDQGAR